MIAEGRDAVDCNTNYDGDVRGHRINAGRRSVLRALALSAITTCSLTRAQPAARIRRIGWLTLVNNYGPMRNRRSTLFVKDSPSSAGSMAETSSSNPAGLKINRNASLRWRRSRSPFPLM